MFATCRRRWSKIVLRLCGRILQRRYDTRRDAIQGTTASYHHPGWNHWLRRRGAAWHIGLTISRESEWVSDAYWIPPKPPITIQPIRIPARVLLVPCADRVVEVPRPHDVHVGFRPADGGRTAAGTAPRRASSRVGPVRHSRGSSSRTLGVHYREQHNRST